MYVYMFFHKQIILFGRGFSFQLFRNTCIPYYVTTNIFLYASLFIAFQVAAKKTCYKYGTYITNVFNITATCLKHINYSII